MADKLERVGSAGWGWVLWPDEKFGPFYVRGHWADVDGIPECVGIEIWKGAFPDTDGIKRLPRRRGDSGDRPGLRGTDLRKVPLPTLLKRLWQREQRGEVKRAQALAVEAVRILDAAEGQPPPEPEAARLQLLRDEIRSLDRFAEHDADAKLAAVAAVYREAVLDRRPPTKAVEEHFHISYSTATKRVGRARAAGLLPPTTPGKASGIRAPQPKRKGRSSGTR